MFHVALLFDEIFKGDKTAKTELEQVNEKLLKLFDKYPYIYARRN